MQTLWRAFVVLLALAAGTLAFGFVLFATNVTRETAEDWDQADGIVVLTGGDNRIEAGAKLLMQGRAKRMLISGVNRRTRREDVQRISGLERETFNCCVDLGYEALDTVGNADEARTWANANNYDRLIIVTSSYHMPRSIAELSLAMPGRQLLPYAVLPKSFPDSAWWLHIATTRVLLSEYLKYLPAAARLAAQRAIGWSDDHSVAVYIPKTNDG